MESRTKGSRQAYRLRSFAPGRARENQSRAVTQRDTAASVGLRRVADHDRLAGREASLAEAPLGGLRRSKKTRN